MNVQIIGSFATGLWSNSSDIDFIMTSDISKQMNIEAIIDKIYNKFKNNKQKYNIS